MNWMDAASGLLGGLGLFLLGMWLLSDGLKQAAGRALRSILESWTRTHLRGLFAGVLLTAAVQSSSAVTVAIIGFVNSGLITLGQAMWVIFGSNVGTSATGWLVALVGLEIKIAAFALPLVGVGMFLRLTGSKTRRGSLGMALVGFGVFFLGVEQLKESFSGLATSGVIDFAALEGQGALGVVMLVFVGAALTALTQSSSAAIALVLTAAQGGLLGVDSAAAVVIGANVGTTSTAMLSTIGATPGAKRVAASHVLFNVITGAVALALLPAVMALVEAVRAGLDLDASPAVVLALFHTTFNVLGVLVVWPIAGRMRRFLEGRFRDETEELGRLRHLDDTVLEVPEVALAALALELSRLGTIATDAARASLVGDPKSVARTETLAAAVESLRESIGVAVGKFQRANLPEDVAQVFPEAIAALQYQTTTAELAAQVAGLTAGLPGAREADLERRLTEFEAAADALIVLCRPDAGSDEATRDAGLEAIDDTYASLKRGLLHAAAQGSEAVVVAGDQLQRINLIRRMCRQAVKAAKRLELLPHPHPLHDEGDDGVTKSADSPPERSSAAVPST